MKNTRHLLGYIVVALLSYFLTKKYFCEIPINKDKCIVPACAENCEKPKSIIYFDTVKKLHSSYFNLTEKIKKADTLDKNDQNEINRLLTTDGMWVEYQEFKKYLQYIERNAKNANINITGLQFILGRSIEDDNKFNQLTFFYNPTYLTQNKEHIAYAIENNNPIPLNEAIRKSLKYKIEKLKNKQTNEASLLSYVPASIKSGIQSQSGNRVQPTPPPEQMQH